MLSIMCLTYHAKATAVAMHIPDLRVYLPHMPSFGLQIPVYAPIQIGRLLVWTSVAYAKYYCIDQALLPTPSTEVSNYRPTQFFSYPSIPKSLAQLPPEYEPTSRERISVEMSGRNGITGK